MLSNNPKAIYSREWRKRNKDRVATYDREYRKRNTKHAREYAKNWFKNHPLELKEMRRRARKKCYAKAPHKTLARRSVLRALRSGRLIKPSACSACQKQVPLHAHHPDYSKRLEVVWLCPSCHSKVHGTA